MGREAECICQIGSAQAHTRVLLESTEIIVRGTLRRRIPISSITELRVDGSKLLFRTAEDDIALDLGPASADKWFAALRKPPATVAQKLGITATTRISVLGNIDCAELSEALASGRLVMSGKPDLIVARVDSQSSLNSAIHISLPFVQQGSAVWFVYTKGATGVPGETAVRRAAREAGLRDTKVASLSPQLTGLRFSCPSLHSP